MAGAILLSKLLRPCSALIRYLSLELGNGKPLAPPLINEFGRKLGVSLLNEALTIKVAI